MGSTGTKKNRMLEIFFRAMKGENISVKSMADEYGVSCKSISRDLGEIKNFLCENRELTGNTELKYAANSKTYYLEFEPSVRQDLGNRKEDTEEQRKWKKYSRHWEK